MNIGIVGSAEDKFTDDTKDQALLLIYEILKDEATALVSGHSPVGGIDLWAESAAEALGVLDPDLIFAPKVHQWDPPGGYGFKARNLDIAKFSDILHVIVVKVYPESYSGRRFKECYHCRRIGRDAAHVKSGGCWTGAEALKLGKQVIWHVLAQPSNTDVALDSR